MLQSTDTFLDHLSQLMLEGLDFFFYEFEKEEVT